MFNLNKALKKVEEKKVDQAELFYKKTDQKEVEIEGNEIKYIKESNQEGIGIRVLVNKKVGFASTSNLDNLDEAINWAINNSEINNLEIGDFSTEKKYPRIKGIYDEKILELEPKQLIEFGEELINSTITKNTKPTTGSIETGVSETKILNSNGVRCQTKTTLINGQITVIAKSEKNKATCFNFETKRSLKDMEFKEIGKEAKKIAKKSLNPKKTPIGEKKIILEPFALSSLLRHTLIPALSAEEIQKGRSRLSEHMGEKIGPEFLEIIDDGTKDGGNKSREFDDEATPQSKTSIINEGVLENEFHDLKTAHRGGKESTGNAFRNSFSDTPSISPTNFVISPRDNINDLYEEGDLVIRSILGAHTANKVTGDFSVGIKNGFKIENGKKTPISQAMLSGNIYELIKNIQRIGDNVETNNSIITPSIKTEARISG